MYQLKEQEETKLWLSQFDHCAKDLELAEQLVDSILYCTLSEFKNNLIKLIKTKLPLRQPSALFIERELQSTKATLPPPHLQAEKNSQSNFEKKAQTGAWCRNTGHKIAPIYVSRYWERSADSACREYAVPQE
ncbi:TPA: hypothetical protein ACKP3N_005309 [Pseudomonas aeruginosa]